MFLLFKCHFMAGIPFGGISWFLLDREAIRQKITAACSSDIKNITSNQLYKYRLRSHSLQQSRRKYRFFSSSAKAADGLKQLHNNLCMSFRMATEGIVFLYCSCVCNCAKNPNFTNCRFSFRKLQIFISQITDFHFVSFHFVSFGSISFRKLQ